MVVRVCVLECPGEGGRSTNERLYDYEALIATG